MLAAMAPHTARARSGGAADASMSARRAQRWLEHTCLSQRGTWLPAHGEDCQAAVWRTCSDTQANPWSWRPDKACGAHLAPFDPQRFCQLSTKTLLVGDSITKQWFNWLARHLPCDVRHVHVYDLSAGQHLESNLTGLYPEPQHLEGWLPAENWTSAAYLQSMSSIVVNDGVHHVLHHKCKAPPSRPMDT